MQLLESHDRRLGERLVREVGKRRAAPEIQRLAKAACCARGVSRSRGCSSACHQCLETVQIELLGLELDDVAGGARHDGRGPERFPQGRDVALQHDLDGPRGILTPELVDDAVRRHDLICVQEQEREHRALLRAAESQRPSAVPCLEWTENPEFHRSAGTLARSGPCSRGV